MSNIDQDQSINGSGQSRPADEAADIFSNLEALRLSPDEGVQIGTEEVLVNVPVRRPHKVEFVRVHMDPAMSLASSIFIDHEREPWFVVPAMRDILLEGVKPVLLLTTVNQRGLPFLWPIALGDGTGRKNAWHDTAREAANRAKREWT